MGEERSTPLRRGIIETGLLKRETDLDCVQTMPAHFENGEKSDGSKICASIHTRPAQFENGRNFDIKNSLQDFDAKEQYLHPKN